MKTIEDALKPLKNSDRVKILMPGGVFMQGKKRKILRDLKYSDYEFNVTETKIQFVPLPFRQNLHKSLLLRQNGLLIPCRNAEAALSVIAKKSEWSLSMDFKNILYMLLSASSAIFGVTAALYSDNKKNKKLETLLIISTFSFFLILIINIYFIFF